MMYMVFKVDELACIATVFWEFRPKTKTAWTQAIAFWAGKQGWTYTKTETLVCLIRAIKYSLFRRFVSSLDFHKWTAQQKIAKIDFIDKVCDEYLNQVA